jgi:hypothetical protein
LINKDILIYIIIIVIGVLIYLSDNKVSQNNNCVILKNGRKIIRNIEKNCIIDLEDIVIEIKDKKVRVLESNCPDKLCVKTGWIEKNTDFIICVPNNLKITIGEANYLDGISW